MPTLSLRDASVKVADEVFLAVALLHREHPEREDFTISKIVERVSQLNLTGDVRPGVRVHALLHCVANRPPNPGRYWMLYATGKHTRRLLLADDEVHPERSGKIFPAPEDLPVDFHPLLEWAKRRFGKDGPRRGRWLAGVLELAGEGKALWRGEDPDEYVGKLRAGWR